jgi:hypothetical protein
LLLGCAMSFCHCLWNSAEMCKFRGWGQIPRLGSKFRGPRKTVGPTDKKFCMRQLFATIESQLPTMLADTPVVIVNIYQSSFVNELSDLRSRLCNTVYTDGVVMCGDFSCAGATSTTVYAHLVTIRCEQHDSTRDFADTLRCPSGSLLSWIKSSLVAPSQFYTYIRSQSTNIIDGSTNETCAFPSQASFP